MRRVSRLPAESRRALLLAATSDSLQLETILRAVRLLGLEPGALELAETAGLVNLGAGRVDWRHPLVRSAVYHNASPGERRAAHGALAEVLRGTPAEERRAWHLAAATLGPDETVAAVVEQMAVSARSRGGHSAAAEAFDRAARLTSEGEQRSRRLLEAGREWLLLGRPQRGREILEDALASARDPLLRADIQYLRGLNELLGGAPRKARDLLLDESSRVESLDTARAAWMLMHASIAADIEANAAEALTLAQRAEALARRSDVAVGAMASLSVARALALLGRAPEALTIYRRMSAELLESDPLTAPPLVYLIGHSLIWIEEYEDARRLLVRAVEAARAASAVGRLPLPLAFLCSLEFRTGRWAHAYANAAESARLAEEVGELTTLTFSLACLAQIEAAQGREDDCRAHVARSLELAERVGAESIKSFCYAALGLLALGLGRIDEAIAHLERLDTFLKVAGVGEPAVLQSAPDLIEAYVLAGRREHGERALAELERQAVSTRGTWSLAAAARCRGMLADADAFEAHFAEALARHGETPTPFERARSELRLGQRRRRARRAGDARPPLRAALEAFEQLGAAPWAEQARAELAATGARRQRGESASAPGLHGLTPHELQVALLVGEGRTNREAAEALFLSPKTVEFHLGLIYRKLEIRSRTELARVLASADGSALRGSVLSPQPLGSN